MRIRSPLAAVVAIIVAVICATCSGYLVHRFVAQQRAQSAMLAANVERLHELRTFGEAQRRMLGEAMQRVDLLSRQVERDVTISRKNADQHVDAVEQLRPIIEGLSATAQRLDAPKPGRSCIEINTIPLIIKVSGSYCVSRTVRQHPDALRFAIAVAADDVEIDLQGVTLLGPHRSDTVSEGIYSAGFQNIGVKNGTISGFMYGVRIDPPPQPRQIRGTLTIQSLTILDSTFRGIAVDFGDRADNGAVASISDSLIARTGGTTLHADAYAIAIELSNVLHCAVHRNRIFDVMPTGVGEGIGISLSSKNRSCVIEDNYLANSERPRWGRTFGFWHIYNNKSLAARKNVVHNFTYGIFRSDAPTFVDNTFIAVDCSPANTGSYYFDLQKTQNRWLEETSSCSDHPREFEAAARSGDPRAQYRMARIVLEGITVSDQTDDEAVRWLMLASEHGSEIARKQLEGLRRAGRAN
jgi:hypothetical protein